MVRIYKLETLIEKTITSIHFLFPQLTQFSPLPDREAIQAIIDSPTTSLWIAENEELKIVGMLNLAIYRTTTGIHAWIEDVVVDKTSRKQGIATLLTLAAVEYARETGAKAVSLTSRPEREAANQLYQKLGFSIVDTNLYRMNQK